MHYEIDYSNSEAKAFDAVEDIKDYLGFERWNKISPEFAKIKDCRQFSFYAAFAGVRGYPVIAWYELYNGQGSWKEPEEIEIVRA